MANKANTPIIPQRQKRDYVVDGEKKPTVNPTKKEATEKLPTAEKVNLPPKSQPGIAGVIRYENVDSSNNKEHDVQSVEAKPKAKKNEEKPKDGIYSSAMKQEQDTKKMQDIKEIETPHISLEGVPKTNNMKSKGIDYGKLNDIDLDKLGQKDFSKPVNQQSVVDISDEKVLNTASFVMPAAAPVKRDGTQEQWNGNTCTILDADKTIIKEYLDDSHTKLKQETVKSGNQTTVIEYNQNTGKPALKIKRVSNNDMIIREQHDTYAEDGITVSSTLLFALGGKKKQYITYKCGPNHNETHVIDYDNNERESQKTVTDAATDKQLSVTTYTYAADGSRTESTKTFDA